MANNVGRIGVVLGLNTAEFTVALETAGKQLEKFGQAIEKYGKLAVTAMVAAGVHALSYADELNDVAKANDTTIESVLRLQEALATNGGEAENAGKIYAGFTKYIDEAAHGSMDAQKRLASMGITLKDIATLGTQDLFEKAIVGSGNTADTITRNANAYAVFGKAVKGVDLKGVAEDLKNANPLIQEQADRITQAAEAWDALKYQSLETSSILASAVGPSILAMIDFIKELKGETSLLGEVFRITFETMAVLAANITTQIIDVGISLQQTMLMFKAFVPGTEVEGKWDEFEKKRETNLARYEALAKRILGEQDFWTAEKKPESSSSKSETKNGQIGRPVIDAYAKETAQLTAKVALASKLLEIEKAQNKLHLQSINGDKTAISLATIDLQLQQQMATIANARAQALANEKLNENQKKLINQDFNLQQQKANEKAKNDKDYILALDKKAFDIYVEQSHTRQLLLDIDKEISDYQLASIGMDKLQVDTTNNALQLKKEIVKIDRQQIEDLQKANLSVTDRVGIISKAEDDRTRAMQTYQQANANVTKQYQEQVDAIKRAADYQDLMYGYDVRSLSLESEKYNMRDIVYKAAQDTLATERKISELMNQQVEALRSMGVGPLYEAENQRIQELINNEQVLLEGRRRLAEEEEMRRQSFTEGWSSAMRQYVLDAENYSRLGSDVFTSAIGNMNSAIDNFARTGQFSFKSFARSIILDTMAMILKFQAMQAILMALRIFGFTGFGSVSLGGAEAYGGGTPGQVGNHAEGGSMASNEVSWVGERGPELFVPRSAGTIIPNNQLSSASGGGGQTVNYNGPYIANMSAIDTQSSMQFLAKNKQSIWAANQSMSRSMPASR